MSGSFCLGEIHLATRDIHFLKMFLFRLLNAIFRIACFNSHLAAEVDTKLLGIMLFPEIGSLCFDTRDRTARCKPYSEGRGPSYY